MAIKIKKSKKGSFTRWAKKKGFKGSNAKAIAAGKKSKSAAIRKKAVFAQNAKKWAKNK